MGTKGKVVLIRARLPRGSQAGLPGIDECFYISLGGHGKYGLDKISLLIERRGTVAYVSSCLNQTHRTSSVRTKGTRGIDVIIDDISILPLFNHIEEFFNDGRFLSLIEVGVHELDALAISLSDKATLA